MMTKRSTITLLLSGLIFLITLQVKASGLNRFQDEYPQDVVKKYGEDSVTCVINLSLYREFFKQWKASDYTNTATFKEIVKPWRWVFLNCPIATENIYVDGSRIMQYLIENEKNEATKQKLIDTLMMIYDQRIKYFPNHFSKGVPQEGSILGRKGVDLYTYDQERFEETYNILKRSVELEGNNSDGTVLIYYFRSVIKMARKGSVDSTLIVDVYDQVIDILDHNIEIQKKKDQVFKGNGSTNTKPFFASEPWELVWETSDGGIFQASLLNEKGETIDVMVTQSGESKGNSYQPLIGKFSLKINASGSWTVYLKNTSNDLLENFKNYKGNIDATFEPFATCEDLVRIFQSKFKKTPDNIVLLKKITNMLDKRSCQDSPLYLTASKRLHELEPSPESAYLIGRLLLKEEKYSESISYLEEATKMKDLDKLSTSYKLLASALASLRNYPRARQMALKALEINPNDGNAYIIIGDLYAASAKDCGDNELTTKVAYWVAVDKYIRARNADSTVAEAANKRIATYSAYFPPMETVFFYDLHEGESYTVGCWINESTTIRAAK